MVSLVALMSALEENETFSVRGYLVLASSLPLNTKWRDGKSI
jgi:hypothetical protein